MLLGNAPRKFSNLEPCPLPKIDQLFPILRESFFRSFFRNLFRKLKGHPLKMIDHLREHLAHCH